MTAGLVDSSGKLAVGADGKQREVRAISPDPTGRPGENGPPFSRSRGLRSGLVGSQFIVEREGVHRQT